MLMNNQRPTRYLRIIGGIIAVVAFLTALVAEFTQHTLLMNLAYIVAVIFGVIVVLPLLFTKSRSNARN
jgi:hypothetical protein